MLLTVREMLEHSAPGSRIKLSPTHCRLQTLNGTRNPGIVHSNRDPKIQNLLHINIHYSLFAIDISFIPFVIGG